MAPPRTASEPFLIGDDGFIPLPGNGGIAVVDAADWYRYAPLAWYATGNGYAYRKTGPAKSRKAISLHRCVLGMEDGVGMEVDHINGDRLDCRRGNLRAATSAQNHQNARVRKGRRFKGVVRVGAKWRARIQINGRALYFGVYSTEEGAALAYNRAAVVVHGAFAHPNAIGA